MNKESIYEAFFKTISDGLEWAFELKDEYVNWVDGIVAMTQNLLNNLDNNKKTECSGPAEKTYSYSGEK